MEEFVRAEIESVWRLCIADRPESRILGVHPESLHIEEYSSGRLQDARCTGKINRVFIRDDTGFREEKKPFPKYESGELREVYWQRGYVSYFIDKEGKKGFFTFYLGPRYGRGWVISYEEISVTSPVLREPRWVS